MKITKYILKTTCQQLTKSKQAPTRPADNVGGTTGGQRGDGDEERQASPTGHQHDRDARPNGRHVLEARVASAASPDPLRRPKVAPSEGAKVGGRSVNKTKNYYTSVFSYKNFQKLFVQETFLYAEKLCFFTDKPY